MERKTRLELATVCLEVIRLAYFIFFIDFIKFIKLNEINTFDDFIFFTVLINFIKFMEFGWKMGGKIKNLASLQGVPKISESQI